DPLHRVELPAEFGNLTADPTKFLPHFPAQPADLPAHTADLISHTGDLISHTGKFLPHLRTNSPEFLPVIVEPIGDATVEVVEALVGPAFPHGLHAGRPYGEACCLWGSGV